MPFDPLTQRLGPQIKRYYDVAAFCVRLGLRFQGDDEDPFRSKHVYVKSRLQERRVHLRRRDPLCVGDREGLVP